MVGRGRKGAEREREREREREWMMSPLLFSGITGRLAGGRMYPSVFSE